MKTTFLIAVMATISYAASAQFSITGTVRDAKTKRALPGATIQLDGKTYSVTDDFGWFRLDKVIAGEHTLVVKFLGYAEKKEIIQVSGPTSVETELEEASTLTDEVVVMATRANEKTPTTFTNVGRLAIQKQNFGQDMPLLLNWTPSVVTTSDAGAGIGYTGIRIRGSDATRVNVTINGIPYNDSESQGTFWVNIPDIASSTQSVQVQRGVGTSTNGAGAFGASVNLQTNSLQAEPYTEMMTAFGSFNTRRYTLKTGTGLINNRWAFDARASKITSDGYVERAASDLASYYISGGYYGKKTVIKAITFGGREKTYQSWYGVDGETLRTNRRMNFAGAIYGADGEISRYYDNQVDDYRQDHYQLHASQQIGSYWNANASLHYTYGRGFFEEYNQAQAFSSLGLQDIVLKDTTLTSSDVIVRRWLDNHFYGGTYSFNYSKGKTDLIIGGGYNQYARARHFGEVIWAQYAGEVPTRHVYYDGRAQKNDFNTFVKWNYDLSPRLNSFVDVQFRSVDYRTDGTRNDQTPYDVRDNFRFFNPKAGVSYLLSDKATVYASYAVAHREPNRSDYLDGDVKPRPERLGNFEAGLRKTTSRWATEVNYYLMNYTDQLVLTGQLDNAGFPIRANVGKSYRTGIELSSALRLSSRWQWNANATWSVNKNKDFVVTENNTTTIRNTTIILSPSLIAGSQLTWQPLQNVQLTWLGKYVGKQYLDNTQNEALTLDDYFLNDLRLNYQLPVKGLKELSFGLLINNLADVRYSSNGSVFDGIAYYYPQAGTNFLMMATVKF